MKFTLPAIAYKKYTYQDKKPLVRHREVQIQYTVSNRLITEIRCLDELKKDEHIQKLLIPDSFLDSKGGLRCLSGIGSGVFVGGRLRKGTAIGHTEHNIKYVVIAERINYVQPGAFQYANGIHKIRWSKSCLRIPECCFSFCYGLQEIENINSVVKIEDSAFSFTGLTSIHWPDNCFEIPFSCFNGCRSLTELYFPSTINKVNDCAFVNCKEISSFSWPENCNHIPQNCFFGCNKLKTILINGAINTIEENAFLNTSIKSFDASKLLIASSSKLQKAFPKDCVLKLPYYL